MGNSNNHYDLVIIGAGFSGLYMLYRARKMGLRARVFEVGDDVGGTWYWNRYPGARCDIESIEYSFEFSEELQQEWVWPERFSAQPDILKYINHVADRFDLRRDIQFNTRVDSATFNEDSNQWSVTTNNNSSSYHAPFLIAASGCLSSPLTPAFNGINSFKGDIYHTGKWPHEPVDFSDKRVAIIGTGSSGIQAIPLIAEQAKHLTVYQRTPAYAAPAQNRPLTKAELDTAKARYDELRPIAKQRFGGFSAMHPLVEKPMPEFTPEERQSHLKDWLEIGGLQYLLSFPDAIVSPETNQVMADFLRADIAKRVTDKNIAQKLMPSGVLGAKRLCSETNYYETFNHDNVSLFDVKEAPIETLTENGIQTRHGEECYDAIVFATGYDAMTGALSSIDIRGIDGCSLKDKWKKKASTYLGLQVAGFPNLLMIAAGPGSPTVFTNVVKSIEHHVDWISDCIKYMSDHGKQRIEASTAAEAAWVEHVNLVANMTLMPQAESWYKGANVPGKAQDFLPYLAGFPSYIQTCTDVANKGYEGFVLS